MKEKKKNLFVTKETTIKEALKKLDQTAEKVLLVTDEDERIIGTLSDGDVRRFILSGKSIEESIVSAYNESFCFLEEGNYNRSDIEYHFREKKIELIPVLDAKFNLVDYFTWEDFFYGNGDGVNKAKPELEIPVVIMAGGKGNRLAPFTHVLPKPLIPVGEKTILELIIDEFRKFGITRYYFTLNFRGEMIRAYFDGVEKEYTVSYVWEEDFYGTAGSLKLLEEKISPTFIVSNCDIILKAEYEKVLSFHRETEADLTVLSSIQHHKIPYGVIEFSNGGKVTGIREKPEYTFPINTGVYVVNKECLEYIPEKKVFNMTDLIEVLIADGRKVFTYPVNEKDYTDIGQWEEYRKTLDLIKMKQGV